MVVHQPSAARGAPPLHQVYGARVPLHQHLDWTLLGIASAPDLITRFREASPREFDGVLLLATRPSGPAPHVVFVYAQGGAESTIAIPLED